MLETMMETTEPLRHRARELVEDGAERVTDRAAATRWLAAGVAAVLMVLGVVALLRVLRNRADTEIRELIEGNAASPQAAAS